MWYTAIIYEVNFVPCDTVIYKKCTFSFPFLTQNS